MIKYIGSIKNLYDASNYLNDETQKELLDYVKSTNELFTKTIKAYDENGEAFIIPSLDLGVPNSVQRLAGGFATGLLVFWNSQTPIIPVDTTVNICTSSIFELSENISPYFTKKYIEKIKDHFIKDSVTFNFEYSNHFMVLCKSNTKYYLVLHSSANNFKNSFLGLYPNPQTWLYGRIKMSYSKDKNRYLRYIIDEDATIFAKIAKLLKEQNIYYHQEFAKLFCKDICTIKNDFTSNNHYYMPSENSVAIGTFIESAGTIVPIFSNAGLPICRFKIGHSENYMIDIDGETKYIIPHGWGQEFISPSKVNSTIYNSEASLYVGTKRYDVNPDERFPSSEVRVRKNITWDNILKSGILNGEVHEWLIPIISYSKKTSQHQDEIRKYSFYI